MLLLNLALTKDRQFVIGIPIRSQGLDVLEYIGLTNSSLGKFTGKNITVAIVDSGIGSHHDIDESRIVKHVSFLNDIDINDDFGHGTFVAGIIGANGKIRGIAPETQFISLKVLDEFGETEEFQLISALDWIINNKQKYNIQVVYFAAGKIQYTSEMSETLDEKIKETVKSGVIIICPAGNFGPSAESITSPATSKDVITVGSINNNYSYDINDATIANYSGRSIVYMKPDIHTLGIDVTSLGINSTQSYALNSGTSFSAAIVTGIVILLLQKYPDYSTKEIRNMLSSYTFKSEYQSINNILKIDD